MSSDTMTAETDRETTAPCAAPRRRRQPRRRWWRLPRRAITLGAAGLLALALVSWYGWRWGFAPLPEPTPGGEWAPLPTRGEDELSTNDYWYWVRALDRAASVNRRDEIIHGWALFDWAQTGHLAQTNRAGLTRFFSNDPALPACFRGALVSDELNADSEWPRRLGRDLLAHARLIRYAAWQACESEPTGRTVEALEHLLDGWRLCVRSGALGLTRPDLALLAGAWRRLALEGPNLDPTDGRRLLDALGEVRDALPRLETAFLQAVQSQHDLPVRLAARRLSLGEVGRQFADAFAAMARETLDILETVLTRVFDGSGRVQRGEARGIRHLARPCGHLLRHLQTRAARPADLVGARDAYVSAVLAALRQDEADLAQQRADALQTAFTARSLLARWFDRPAVWRSLADYPPVRPLVEEARASRATLESCRLVLALRLYRDRHGAWPDRLDALVPEWLAELPNDPYTGRSFAYQREGNGWLVQAAYPDARAPEPPDEGILFHSAEPAEARLLRLISGQGGQLTGVMDVQLLQRYGLLPKGLAGFLSQMRTNQPLAQALSILLPSVTDLRSLIRLGEAGASRTARSE